LLRKSNPLGAKTQPTPIFYPRKILVLTPAGAGKTPNRRSPANASQLFTGDNAYQWY